MEERGKPDHEEDEVREVSAWSVAPRDGALSRGSPGGGGSTRGSRTEGWGAEAGKGARRWKGQRVAASSGTLSTDVEPHASRAMPDY